jgi:hypothetical protein
MPTFTNKSQATFQDGDLIVLPGESFSTEDEARMRQMREMYAWQFEESKGEKGVPTEAEALAEGPAKPVRELRDTGYVALDEAGNQAELVDGKPAKK